MKISGDFIYRALSVLYTFFFVVDEKSGKCGIRRKTLMRLLLALSLPTVRDSLG